MGIVEKMEYRRDGGNNYMVLPRIAEKEDYREKMLLRIRSEHLLNVDIRNVDGVSGYYYEMRSAKTLKHIAAVRDLKGNEIRAVLIGIEKLINELSEYLLSPYQLVLLPECVALSADGTLAKFCYYPQMEEEGGTFFELAEFLMKHTDHEDSEAKRLSYGYFGKVSDGEINPGTLLENCQYEEGLQEFTEPAAEKSAAEDDTVKTEEDEYRKDYENGFKDFDKQKENKRKSTAYERIIGTALVFLAAEIMIMVFLGLNPGCLKIMQPDVKVVTGGGLFLIAVTICIVVYCIIKKKKESEEDKYMEKEEVIGQAENEEYEMEKYESDKDQPDYTMSEDEGTVLLIDNNEKNNPLLLGKQDKDVINIEINKTPFVVGTSLQKADGVIKAIGVSRVHAVIKNTGEDYYIMDMNSTNGTFVNGDILNGTKEMKLKNGDRLRLANVELTFVEGAV